MSDPSTATPEGASVIHDLGYRPYTGPRLGEGAIARSLSITGFRNAFGLGRSGRSKVLPFVLLALNVMPAVIVGTISLYLARPLRSSAYAVARWVSLLAATLVFLVLPILVLYAAALLVELDVSEQTREAAVALGLAGLLALSLAGVAGLIASWSTRRGFAVVATIALLVIANGIVTTIQGLAGSEGRPRIGEVAGLFSPYSLYRGLIGAWTGADTPTPPSTTGMELTYLAVLVGLSAACLAALVWRYRRVSTA